MRLLHVSEKERLQKLKENNKLINLKEQINGETEEFLEDESDIKHINNMISV